MFKRKTGKLLTGICSTALAFSMVFTTAPMTFASSVEDSGTKTVEYAESTVLYESDYNGVTNYGDYGENKYYVGWNNALAGNTFPRVVDGNGFISYTQSTMHLGVIRLGHDYKTSTFDTYNYIEAVPGKTYVIEYDFKIYANTYAQSTEDLLAQGWPQDGGDMEIGVAVANPTASVADMSLLNYKNGTSNYQVFDKYMLKSNPDSKTWDGNKDGWVHKKIVYTVPTDINVSTNKALQIFIGYGSRCEISFDNIKVTSASKYSGDVLAEEDFSGATVRSDAWSTADSCGGCWPVLSTVDNTDNKVIMHKPNYWGHGVIPVGAPMTGNAQNSAAAITAEAGATYRIEFDYYLSGTNNSSAYEVGLEVGKVSGQNVDNGPAYLFRKSMLSFPKNTTFEGKWKRASADITIPEGTNFSNDDKLMIYFLNGHGSDVLYYYDNLTVIKINSSVSINESDNLLSNNDYSTAASLNQWDLGNSSLDVIPATDPLNSNNKTIEYKQYRFGKGALYLGALFDKGGTYPVTQAVTVEAGKTYSVKFDYYVKNTPFNDLRAYLTVGQTVIDSTNPDNNKIDYDTVNAVSVLSLNAKEKVNVSGWETKTVNITIPSDYSFNHGKKLMIYIVGGGNGTVEGNEGRVEVFFDNLTVTELAPVSVKFVVNGGSEYKVFGGNNITYPTSAGKSMVWYTDNAKTKSFGFDFYNNAGKLDSLTLYGEEVKSDVPLIKGDVNCDGAFSSEDLVSMRKVLLGDQTLASDYHADITSDGGLDVIDLVRIKKTMANTIPTAYTINGNAVSNYKIVYAENLGSDVAENKNVLEYVNSLAALTGINAAADSEAATEYEIIIGNANRGGVVTDLAENSYIVKAEGNKLYVNGGSVNALIAAIKTLIGHINTGKEINETYFVNFEYSGGDFPTTLSLAFSEDFSTDFTGAINNNNNDATASYRDNWTQTYYDDLSNTTTKAENGNLVLYGESYTAEDGSTAYRGGEVNTAKFYSYGYFEIRAKVNASTGICPAFWLCGNRNFESTIEYEVDIFECFGKDPKYLKGTLLAHNYPNGADGGKTSTETGFTYEQLTEIIAEKGETYFYNDKGWGDEYHTFGLDWQYDSITWYIDGQAVMRATPSNAAEGQYVYNEPMRVRLTCYAGRALGGEIGETTDWVNGNSLVVDYLRIYQYN